MTAFWELVSVFKRLSEQVMKFWRAPVICICRARHPIICKLVP